MLKVRLPFRLLGAVLLVLVAGGCSDLAGPAATTGAPAPSISASYLDIEEPQSLGRPQEVPANAGLGVPGWEQASNIGPLPDSAWIVIEVRGTVLHTKHPWCDQLFSASGGCNYTLDGLRLGPLERHGGSGVIVTLESPGAVPHPFFSSGYYQYAPDGNVHGDVARTVVRNTTGAKVLWFRRLDATPKPGNATTGLYGPMYYMSSNQKVTARVIPSPLRVDAPATVPPGEVATFSVSPTSDFKFQMPDSRRHFVYWRYFPGDTAARPNPFGPRQDVPCDGVVCRWEPPQNGRMWAFTYVDGFGVDAQSQIVRVENVQLELKCNGTPDSVRVTRGNTVACEATGSTEILGWEFVADSSGYRNPAEGATPFKGTEWKGPVVLSGTVTVRARIGGNDESKAIRVRIAARDWNGMEMPRSITEEEPATDLPLRPDSLHDLGHIHQTMDLEFGRDKWEPILSGPNANLAYLVKPPAEYRAVVHVNRAALSRDSDFWNAQYSRQRSSGLVDCLQREENITGFIPVILRHEGIGFDPKSHAYLYVTTAERVGNPRYERVIGSTLRQLADEAEGVGALVRDSAVIATGRADSTGYAPQWCRFHFNYRGR